MSNLIFVCSG